MARRGDTRSPSPTGSSHSARRSRREDDRYARDRKGDRGYRSRRSRSRSAERRHNDRDRDAQLRRDRSIDRRDNDGPRSNRRDRSRERRRSRSPGRERERDRDRDRRYRSRERDNRGKRDDSRDRRRRRDDSTDSRRNGDRRAERDTGSKGKSAPSNKQSEEDKKKAERLAKLEAWKAKQAAERERKQKEQEAAAVDPRSLLQEMDRKEKAAQSPSTLSPQSPTADSGTATPVPAPYAGKFDPKAIAKKAASNAAIKAALGDDIALPVKSQASATSKVGTSAVSANNTKAALSDTSAASNFRPLKAKGNLSGFGLGSKAAADTDMSGTKKGLDLAEEETTRRKLEKLPTPPPDTNVDDAVLANGADEGGEDDEDVAEGGTEEEEAAAARAAAEKRAELLQNEMAIDPVETNGDLEMAEAPEPATNGTVAEVEEDDVDPLDAFMTGLGDESAKARPRAPPKTMSKKNQQQEPEAMFSDAEEDIDTTEPNPDDILAIANKKKKKDIPTVNHAKMYYDEFRKNFYSEPVEMSDMTEGEVASLRLELDGIKVRGVDVPKPVINWAQCGLGAQTLDVIRNLGYDAPTSIQSQAIPTIMSGRDVIGVAKTGSGKTIAFLLPMFRHIKDQRPIENLEGPIGLVLTPTRELCTQIFRECKPFLKALNLRAVCAYGGAPIKEQIAELKRGAEVVVCTPGRMIDLLAANSGRVTNLRRVTYTVLDEADRMFDMGFEPQVMKMLANIRPQRQTVLFSATFPRNMEALARKTLVKPVEIIVGGRSVVAPEITQIVEILPEEKKFVRLLGLLGDLFDNDEDSRALIFVERQETADRLLSELLHKAYPCDSIHGGKDQVDRDSVINDFKAGVLPIMIATSVAARGLDVKQLKLVVNYDAPNHLEDYVHRAGRTGRAGNTGTAVTFVTEDQDRYSVDIAKALKQSGQPIPEALQNLVDGFMEKVQAGKERAAGSGFGGRGLERLDQERDTAKNRERRAFKTGDEPEEEEKEEGKKDADDEIMLKATGGAGVQSRDAPAQPTAVTGTKPIPGLDEKIIVHKTEKPDASTNASNNPLDKVRAAVASIDDRLTKRGQLRPGQPIDNKGPDAGAFHATLEINDFPQKARWAVTNRTNVAKILEATGTSITTKGSFYPPGKIPDAGENPKLYILVEGDTEVVVRNAMQELLRLLREGTVAASDAEARAGPSGRYNVV